MLRDVSPAAERNIAETRAELAEEAALLERRRARGARRRPAPAPARSRSRPTALAGWEPALRRLALRALAERAAGRQVPLGPRRAPPRSSASPRSPRAARSSSAAGCVADLRVGHDPLPRRRRATPRPAPVAARAPGRARVGDWEVRAELHPGPVEPAGPDLATLDARRARGRARGPHLARGRPHPPARDGGHKTLGDLFTDRGVPRSLRAPLPVVTVDGEVAWVAGVAVSERLPARPGHRARGGAHGATLE